MRKEVLVAIFIGIVLGTVVAFGIWRANFYLSPKQVNKTEQIPTPEVQQVAISSGLVITQPEENSVISTESVVVKGSTNPNSTIVITSNSDGTIVDAGSDGSFEQEINLEGGPNQIDITSYDKDGNEDNKTITLVYSTEFSDKSE